MVELRTDRLIMRPPQMEDFPRYVDLMADEETCRYIGGTKSRSEAWRAFMTQAGAWSLTGVAMFSLIEKETGLWVGQCGPWCPADWPAPEVGWTLHRDAWGKGYATEAGAAAIRYAFEELGWERVIHIIDLDNHASAAVAKRLGSSVIGPCQMPPPYEDHECEMWGQTRA